MKDALSKSIAVTTVKSMNEMYIGMTETDIVILTEDVSPSYTIRQSHAILV
jgi:hypothetical protein